MTNPFPTQKQNLRRFGRADEGQALVLTGLALIVLMLMAGLGVDVGYLRYEKQQMQKAADAGAIAGASAMIYGADWHTAAQNDTQANGFTNGQGGISVRVDKPWEGPFANQDGYVEVSVSQPNQPTFFMRVGGVDTVPVRSWAVASAGAPGSGCIYSMDPSSPDTFDVNGNVNITSACGIYINSSSTDALVKSGVSGQVDASYVGIVGQESQSKLTGVASDLTPNHEPVTGIAPFTDPLITVPEPTPLAGCTTPPPPGTTFYPGTYCGGISISDSRIYTFKPGLYTLLGGGMTVNGAATLNGTGVTFYNTYDGSHPYGGVSIGGSVKANLSAPTDSSGGGVPGMLFFQNRSYTPTGQLKKSGSSFGGTSGQTLIGALYFPTTLLTYNGTPASSAMSTIMVGWQLAFSGNVTISQYTSFPGGGGPITTAVLAE